MNQLLSVVFCLLILTWLYLLSLKNLLEQVTLQGNQISNVLEKQQLNYDDDDDDDSDGDHGPGIGLKMAHDLKSDDQGDGWAR